MKIRAFFALVLCCGIGSLSSTQVFAQTPTPQALVAKSDGLELSIINAFPRGNDIIVEFELKNATPGRVYVRDAQKDGSQSAFLASGKHLNHPYSIVSINVCEAPAQWCAADNSARDLNNFSYIENDQIQPFSFQYGAGTPLQQHETISFSVALVARFTHGDPDNAAAARVVRFNFARVPISQ